MTTRSVRGFHKKEARTRATIENLRRTTSPCVALFFKNSMESHWPGASSGYSRASQWERTHDCASDVLSHCMYTFFDFIKPILGNRYGPGVFSNASPGACTNEMDRERATSQILTLHIYYTVRNWIY